MSGSPSEAAPQSQKRPLEEPSSPNGPADQPDAKRPALDKVVDYEPAAPSLPSAPVAADGSAVASEVPASNGAEEQNGTTDVKVEQEVKVEQDAPAVAGAASAAAHGLPVKVEDAVASPGHQDETSWLHIRAIISSQEAATIIGRGGENVSVVRAKAGARCTVSDYTRGAVERILTVSGVVESVSKAFGLIIRTLNNENLDEKSSPQSKTYPLRLLIPHILVGAVIGKGGVRIREIQDASGARLNVSDQTLPLSTERSLVVLGVADAVHIATYYIAQTLNEQLTDKFGGPAASAYATRSGAPTGVAPGGMQVIPYSPQPVGGQWGHPDSFRKNAQNAQRTPMQAWAAQAQYPQPPLAQHPPPVHDGSGSPPRFSGAGPHMSQPPQYTSPHAGHPAAPQSAGSMQNVPHGQPLTQQIFIPNDMVGAIIGKGGAKINEIRQLSSSVIKINEPQDNSNERLVTITGTAECNQMALYMLYSRLGM